MDDGSPGEILPLWHGWWDRAESIAGHVAKYPAAEGWLGFPERKDAALDGIVEAIHELGGWPSEVHVLFRAGSAAVSHAASEARKHQLHGVFWLSLRGSEDELAEQVTDRLAVRQLVWALSEDQWLAVWCAAEVMKRDGDQVDAAALAGLSLAAFKLRLSRARKTCRALWVAPDETPSARKYSTVRADGSRSKIAVNFKQQRYRARKRAAGEAA